MNTVDKVRRAAWLVRYELGLVVAFIAVPLVVFALLSVDWVRLVLAGVAAVLVAVVFRRLMG